ncbi:DNA double-strand break repair nuclease NurA [Leptospira sp. WS58.C1]|uniref:DNA double-strand break repair nuclease NurA n=1 Tax=Leptospira cinconiae TaxID=3235173 RepID=UPI00349EA893
MENKNIICLDWNKILSNANYRKIIDKGGLPLGKKLGFISTDCEFTLFIKDSKGKIVETETESIQQASGIFFIKGKEILSSLLELHTIGFLYLFIVGSTNKVRVNIHWDHPGQSKFSKIEAEVPTFRAISFGLPPIETELIDSQEIIGLLSEIFKEESPDLYKPFSDTFLKSPHVLTNLFGQVLSISSRDQIDFISNLRYIADELRNLLIEANLLKKSKKDHRSTWDQFFQNEIAYLDGGMSRVSGLPSVEPNAVRVGVYSVKPGVRELSDRESWYNQSFVVSDVMTERYRDNDPYSKEPDDRRVREAARYILELLMAFYYPKIRINTKYLFIHGPLVNSFQMYDEGEPHFIPGVSPDILSKFGINKSNIQNRVDDIPKEQLWNQAIAVYTFLCLSIFECDSKIIGVVERTGSSRFTQTILAKLRKEEYLTDRTYRKFISKIERFRMQDEYLFGCILDEGEWIEPTEFSKNKDSRARSHWNSVVDQIPSPWTTMIKTSRFKFPFRVEMNVAAKRDIEDIAKLLYHTSLLLPNYAFPVGLDIVDKYVKIPDWLSKGISTSLSSQLLMKAMRTGNPRLIEQTRQRLSRNPRDFFFRPTSQ